MKLLQYKKTFEDEEHRKYWLIRVTVNLCKNYLRSGYKQKVQCLDQVSMQEILELSGTEQEPVSETDELVFRQSLLCRRNYALLCICFTMKSIP